MDEHDSVLSPIERQLRWPSAPDDDLCDEFESSWRRGEAPRIEDYVARSSDRGGLPLFSHLLQVELHWRRKRNEELAQDDYLRRFPTYADAVTRAFSAESPSGSSR